MPLPPPRCDCAHDYSEHEGGLSCKYRSRPAEADSECSCSKFLVPNSGGRGRARKPKKSSSKSAPWWR